VAGDPGGFLSGSSLTAGRAIATTRVWSERTEPEGRFPGRHSLRTTARNSPDVRDPCRFQ
jgi:hypothetical protein